MALHNKKDFSIVSGVKTKDLSTYASRNKIIIDKNGLIDDQNPVNITFIERHRNAAIVRRLATQIIDIKNGIYFTKSEPEEAALSDSQIADLSGKSYLTSKDKIPDIDYSQSLSLFLDNVKKAKEIELLKLRAGKIKGEAVPLDMIAEVINCHHSNILQAMIDITEKDKVDAALEIASSKTAGSLRALVEEYFTNQKISRSDNLFASANLGLTSP